MGKIIKKYRLKQIVQNIKKPWMPVEVARFNNQILRVAKFEGEYHWHSHKNEDEFFLVYKGSIIIYTQSGPLALSEEEGIVIPRGIKHKPFSKEKSIVLMIEPISLKSAGD